MVDVETFTVHSDGVVAMLWFRECAGVRQWVWIRQDPPGVLADAALRSDLVEKLLAVPEAVLSPADRGIVNFETWLATVDRGPVSATASIPGLSVTATAVVASTTWTLGDDVVVCEGAGTAWSPGAGDGPAPCGYTFTRAAGRDGTPHTISVVTTWDVSWAASTGATGTLESISSDPATIDYPIDEIQTIGTRG